MSESSKIMESMLDRLNTASAHEYDIRRRNNELYDLTQTGALTLDMLRKIDEVQAEKARSILLGHSEANPWAVTAVNSMMGAMSDNTTEAVEALIRVLEELVTERSHLAETDSRYAEVSTMIEIIEKMLVVHATSSRAKSGAWWMPH